jgi:PBP1b-binding outer membrane lipoprotein LpoB
MRKYRRGHKLGGIAPFVEGMIMRLIFITCILVLTGCVGSNRQEQSVSVETKQGIEAGQPTNLVIRRQERTDEQAQTGVDVGAVVQAAMAGFKGDILGALDKMKPQPVNMSPLESKLDAITAAMTKPGDPVFPTGEVVGGSAAALAALLAFLKHREAAKAREREDDAWEAKAKALAALPPEEAKKLLA